MASDLTLAQIEEGERLAQAREDAWAKFVNDDDHESVYARACDAFGTWAAENFASLAAAARERDALLAKVARLEAERTTLRGDVSLTATVRGLFARRPTWSADEIAIELEIPDPRKPLYNALSQLKRDGEINSLAYGVYVRAAPAGE